MALGDNGSLLRAAKVTKKITDEGIVLLKNTNKALPLAKNSDVIPFGYRYKDPVYGGTISGAGAVLTVLRVLRHKKEEVAE